MGWVMVCDIAPMLTYTHQAQVGGAASPLGPLGFNSPNIAQRHALHVARAAEKAFMLSDRV